MAGTTGLFGGSFDPIHVGHLIIARSVAEQVGLDRVIFLPAATPPHKEPDRLTLPEHREAMVRLAVEGEPHFSVSDFDLARTGPTYTVDTVAHFRSELGTDRPLYWIIGGDSLAELHTWYHVDALATQCRIVTAGRPGWARPDLTALRERVGAARLTEIEAGILATPRIDVSATDIRARIRAKRSIRYLVPEAVRAYIERHQLYVR